MQTRFYGRSREVMEIPDLMELQTRSYLEFLQADAPYSERKNTGLEAILREVYPIQSFDGTKSLEYLYYELGQPRYSPDECRRLRSCTYLVHLRKLAGCGRVTRTRKTGRRCCWESTWTLSLGRKPRGVPRRILHARPTVRTAKSNHGESSFVLLVRS